MIPGYKGSLLHIDLSEEKHQKLEIPEVMLKKYIGGRGLGAKLYKDLISPETGPFDPKNVLMVLSGPLSGTMAPSACKHVIITKSPATGGWLETYSSGHMAQEMKCAGYDGLIITGKAKQPCYVLIEDDKVSFNDAHDLWGKGAFEAEAFVKKMLHPKAGAISIGQAGENLLKISCIGSDYYRKAGRGGAGAVMGSKNLKALAIKGSSGIECSDINKIYELIEKHHAIYLESPIGNARHQFGTPLTLNITHSAGMLPTRNFSRGQFEEAIGKIDKDGVANATVGSRACGSCFISCSKRTHVIEGLFAGTTIEGPEYETIGLFGSNLENSNLPSIIHANYLCDDLGMDTISAGNIVGFAMECYEKGILTKEDTGGLDLKFGNYTAMVELLKLMAKREGFGKLCAEGVKEMAKQLGQNTEDFAMHSKGLEFPAYDPRAGWGSTITYSVTPRGGCHRRAWPPMKEVLGGVYPYTIENKAKIVIEMMNDNSVMHSILVCDFPGKFIPLATSDWKEYVNAVTGLNYTAEELDERAEITETLIRLINIGEGFSSADDMLPKRIIEEAHPTGPPAGKVIGMENFMKMRSEYYALRGWDSDGNPTSETLSRYAFEDEPVLSLNG